MSITRNIIKNSLLSKLSLNNNSQSLRQSLANWKGPDHDVVLIISFFCSIFRLFSYTFLVKVYLIELFLIIVFLFCSNAKDYIILSEILNFA